MEQIKVKKISLKKQVFIAMDRNNNIMAGNACPFTKKCDRFIDGVCPTEKNTRSKTFQCGTALVKAQALTKKK